MRLSAPTTTIPTTSDAISKEKRYHHHHRSRCCFRDSKGRGGRRRGAAITTTTTTTFRAAVRGEDEERRTTSTTSSTATLSDLNTSPRRVFLAAASTSALALGANFLGVTSGLLSLNEQFARELRLDAIYDVKGYRRDRNEEKGYEFLFPNEYLADQTIAQRNALRRAQSLDLPSLSQQKKKNVGEPESAFGPMGTNGEENMSVIVQTSTKGFDLGQFGNAEEQANWLLENALARPGSGKEAKLYSASETVGENGIKYYQFEYTIKTANWYRRNVAVFAQNKKTGDVYTFVAQCPVERWDEMGVKFRKSANSFRVFTPKPPSF